MKIEEILKLYKEGFLKGYEERFNYFEKVNGRLIVFEGGASILDINGKQKNSTAKQRLRNGCIPP